MSSLTICKHCGTPVPPQRSDDFCCAGCAFVFDMLHSEGMEHFYQLRAGQPLAPVAAQALREQDWAWLAPLVEKAEEREHPELCLSIQGLSCIGCIWLIERLFQRRKGARVLVDITRGEITLAWQKGAFDVEAFLREVQQFGYLVGPRRDQPAADSDHSLARRAGACGAFAMNAMAFSLPAYFGMPADFAFAPWFDLIAAASATLALFVGGSYFAERSWRSLQAGVLHIDTPITLGIIAAYLGSLGGWVAGVGGLKYFDFVAMFIFLMLGGRWLQQAAVARNRRRLLRDPSLSETVTVDGKPLALAELQPGMTYEIKPGQALPVASELAQAQATVSLEWINGESEALRRTLGQLLPSGALNITAGTLSARALEAWEGSTLRQLLDARRAGDQRDLRLERLLRWYLATVVVVGVLGALWWWLVKGDAVGAVQVMISIFVVSCPCALGVAAPFADDLAASRAERLGVFVRSIGLWKKLARTKKFIFDKTGTLTMDHPVLENADTLQTLTTEQRSALRHLVGGNLHPVSRSLFDAVGPDRVDRKDEPVSEEPGVGLAFVDHKGRRWSLQRPAGEQPGVDAEFLCDGVRLAGFRFADQLRPETREEVRKLREQYGRVIILSGDRESKVAHVAAQLGLPAEDWHHSLRPDEKARIVAALDENDTLYVGDGANDSLAFDAASCNGSPVSGRSFLEHKADFYFLGHSMGFVSRLLNLARLHRLAIHRVFTFALLYNIATVVAGLQGYLNPLAAAVLMPLSSVVTLSLVGFTFRRQQARPTVAQEPLSDCQTEVGAQRIVC